MIKIHELALLLNLNESKIINCYLFGSRVYNTHSEDSDFDLL